MKKILRILTMVIAICLIATALFSCGNSNNEDEETTTGTDAELESVQGSDTQSDEAQSDTQTEDTQTEDTQTEDTQTEDTQTEAKEHVYDNACDATCNLCGENRVVIHDYADNLTADENTHYYGCSVCGDKKDETAHVFDKAVASSEYLKAAATETTKTQYFKSCVCGKASATEYFETDKTVATLNDIQDLSKTYDKIELANPTYTTNSDGAVSFEWYQDDVKLDSKPVNAGTYKVKVIVAESTTYAGVNEEKEFTITKRPVWAENAEFVYNGYDKWTGEESSKQIVFQNLASDESMDSSFVSWDFNSVNVGAELAGVTFVDEDEGRSNYTIDLSKCSASIIPKLIDNLTYAFEYNGYEYHQVIISKDDHAGIIGDDQISLEVCFATPNVGAALDTSEETGFEPGFIEENYVLGAYDFTLVPLPITLDAESYTAEYNGTNTLTADISEFAVGEDTLKMIFTATKASHPISLPLKAVGIHQEVALTKIKLDNDNYVLESNQLSDATLEIAKKKLSNLDLKITEATYNDGKIKLLTKDGIIGDESVTITITQYSAVTVGDVIELVISESAQGPGNELVAFETIGNYEFALDENGIVGKVTIVAACDVQFDGSCSCGNSHITQVLTVPDGEPNGNLAEVHLDQYYEGGIYKMSLEGGQYGITLSEYYINYTVYNSDGIKIKPISGKFIVSGDIYIHVEVDDTPNSSDYVKVIKYAKLLDIENEEIIVTQIIKPDDLSYRDEEIADYHSGGDRFVIFYSRNEEDDVLGCSVYFYYADDDDKYLHKADSNIESMEFYDINGIQLPITYDNPDMLRDDGVTAIGGVYIVITMNGEGENLRFSAC